MTACDTLSRMRDQTLKTGWVVRGIPIAAALVWLASLTLLMTVFPAGTPISSEPGADPVPYWVTLVPIAAGIGLVLLIPRRSPTRPALMKLHRPFVITTAVLVLLAVAFPLAVANVPLDGELYILGKLVFLMLIPAAVIIIYRGGVKIHWNHGPSRWWAPAIVILVWSLLSQVVPWNPAFDPGDADPLFIVVAATATAITAGVGEELFYRRWLQTRFEAALGAWPGIVLASLAFALMHLGSHGTGRPVLDIARVIVIQGSFGLFLGIMWWRYRNLTAIIFVHIIVNGRGVAAALLARGEA
jgi:uncharacterized protein